MNRLLELLVAKQKEAKEARKDSDVGTLKGFRDMLRRKPTTAEEEKNGNQRR